MFFRAVGPPGSAPDNTETKKNPPPSFLDIAFQYRLWIAYEIKDGWQEHVKTMGSGAPHLRSRCYCPLYIGGPLWEALVTLGVGECLVNKLIQNQRPKSADELLQNRCQLIQSRGVDFPWKGPFLNSSTYSWWRSSSGGSTSKHLSEIMQSNN